MIIEQPTKVYDVFKFRRFRLNLIGFLKLPLGINENALRTVLKDYSATLLANYEARAELASPEFDATTVLPAREGDTAD